MSIYSNLHTVTLASGGGKRYDSPSASQIMDNQRPAQGALETVRALDLEQVRQDSQRVLDAAYAKRCERYRSE